MSLDHVDKESLKDKVKKQRGILILISVVSVAVYAIIISYVGQDKAQFNYNDWRRLLILAVSVIGVGLGVYFFMSINNCPSI